MTKKWIIVVSIVLILKLLFIYLILGLIRDCCRPENINIYKVYLSTCTDEEIAEQEKEDEIYFEAIKKREYNEKEDIRRDSPRDSGE